MREWKLILAIIGSALNCVAGIVLYCTFLEAWFHNDTIKVYINVYHEKYFELFFIPLVVASGIWSFVYLFKYYRRKILQ